jgi:sugar lactone lactonase YvrE
MAKRVVRWKVNAKNGEVIAGGNGIDQLRLPTDVVVDKKNSSLIICDQGSDRLLRVFHHNLTLQPTVILTTGCYSLVIDRNGDIYISDIRNNVVKRWKEGESDVKVIIGGNKTGDSLNQLNFPSHIFVDDDYSIYVSDSHNNRVIKWMKDAKEGIVVSGLYYNGNGLMQLDEPTGIIVDHSGNIYVADKKHFQVVRFLKGSQEGSFVVGQTRYGSGPNQLFFPGDILFDQQGNLYVADFVNYRVQKFYVNS